MDETQHPLSTKGRKGAVKYHNPSFNRPGDRGVDSSRHITGVYATNPHEVLPPLYIFDSKATNPSNFKVEPSWVGNLPYVTGHFGMPRKTLFHSEVAVRPKGSMDESLFESYIRRIICQCYPNASQNIKRDPETGKLLEGPVFLKVDSGPGRLSRSASSIAFREQLWNKGIIIILGLPNATEATQEMDDLYQTFKPRTYRSAQRAASIKLARRIEARKRSLRKQRKKRTAPRTPQQSELPSLPPINVTDKDESSDPEDSNYSDSDGSDSEYKETKKKPCVVNLDCEDLSFIVNGHHFDPVELRPFRYTFTKDRIWKSWCNIGWIPMTRKCLEHHKVRHELVPGGADEGARKDMETWKEDYEDIKKKCQDIGLKTDSLNVDLEACKETPEVLANREDLIKKLVETKATTSAGRAFKYIGTTMVNGPDLLEAARIENEREAEIALQKKIEMEAKTDRIKKEAIAVYQKFVERGRPLDTEGHPDLEKADFTAIIKFLFPIVVPKEAASLSYSSKPKAKKRLERLKVENGIMWEDEMERIMEEEGCDDTSSSSDTKTDSEVATRALEAAV